MTKTIQAVFENGVLRPLSPLNLRDMETVTLSVSQSVDGIAAWEDSECYETHKNDVDVSVSLEQVQQALSKITGSMSADFAAEREER